MCPSSLGSSEHAVPHPCCSHKAHLGCGGLASQLLSPWPKQTLMLPGRARLRALRPTGCTLQLSGQRFPGHSAFSFKVCLLLNQVSTANTVLPFQGAPGSFRGGRAGLLMRLSHPVGLSVMLSETRLPGKSGHLQVHCDSRCHVPDNSLPGGPVSAPLLTSQTNIFFFPFFNAILWMISIPLVWERWLLRRGDRSA